MKMMMNVLIIAMAASAAAQSPATATKVKTQLTGVKPSPAAPSTQAPTAKPAAATTKPIVHSPMPVKASSTAANVAAKPAAAPVVKVATPTAPATKPEEKPAQAPEKKRARFGAEGRRDPFVSPVMERVTGAATACSGGKKCLVPDQIALRGIIRTSSANIAVVVTADNRAYFLHENDPISNGVVIKISETSITFREQIKDNLGKPTTREVVKKINTQV